MSKISELSDGGVIQGGDTLIAVRSGGNVKVTYGGSTTANIDGGTIDGTVIGGSSAAAGTFTTGQFNTSVNVDGTVTADGLTITTATPSIQMTDSDNNADAYIQGTDGNIRFYADDNNEAASSIITFNIDGGEKVRITDAGSVGIGTTTVSQRLDVQTSTVNTGMLVYNTNTASGASVPLFLASESDGSTTNVSVENSGAGNMAFRTGATTKAGYGSERMRIDSSGNVGIGVTPSAWTTNFSVRAFQLGGGSVYSYDNNRVFVGQNVAITGAGSDTYVNTAAASAYRQFQGAHAWFTAPSGTADAAISFTQAMTLDASGNLLVGVSTFANNTLGVAIRGASGGATDESIRCAVPSTGSTLQIGFYNANGRVGSISTDGSSTVYNTSSDERLKENITDANDAGDKIDAIKVRQYDWKVDGFHQDYGMVAQELMTVAPEAVSGDPESDEMMGVDYSKLVPMLIKEVQSLRARVAQLEGAN